MTNTNPLIQISPKPDQPNLSKGQKTFNTLVKKIEASRQTLLQWQGVALTFEQKVAGSYAPLLKTFREGQAVMVRRLDQALDRKGLNKSERQVVQKVICQMAEHLFVDTGDESIKTIYNKHSDTDFDSEEAAAVNSMKSAVEAMFEVDLGDGSELNSPEEILAHLHEQMEKDHLRRVEEQDQRSRLKKTAKQRARDEKLKTEADETSLSIREVYRKLVSALHPDREPDPQERARKTALMQRVNQAYGKKDLLRLLELQLELEHIDAHTIAGLSEHRLKHFNKILKDQLTELQQEISHVEMPFRKQFHLPPHQPLPPTAVIAHLMREISELRHRMRLLEKELLMPNDLVAFKLWIKSVRREIKERDAQRRDEDEPQYI